jgi:hypothetical protein
MLVRNHVVKNANVRLKGPSRYIVCSLAIPFALLGTQRAHGQVCQVYCDGFLAGDCPGGVGCPQTPEECLSGLCLNPIACGCLSLTDCKWDGASILPAPVCGNGRHEGTEECDPGVDPTGFGENDCACPDQCKADCTCAAPIPTVSEWGLVILALSLLTGAKLRFGRRTAAG